MISFIIIILLVIYHYYFMCERVDARMAEHREGQRTTDGRWSLFLFCARVSCKPHCPQTHCVDKDDLELLVLMSGLQHTPLSPFSVASA